MKLTDQERAALVEEIVKIRCCPVPVAIADSAMMVDKYRAEIIANLIDRLWQRADAPGLDELLDSVHPEATIDLGITLPGYQDKGRWGVSVFVPSGTTWESTREVNGLVRRIEAFGSTRMDAIRNAAAQATSTQEGTEHEQDV